MEPRLLCNPYDKANKVIKFRGCNISYFTSAQPPTPCSSCFEIKKDQCDGLACSNYVMLQFVTSVNGFKEI